MFKDDQPQCLCVDPAASGGEANSCISDDFRDVQWRLVTSQFKEAATELELGELIHDNGFSLYEGMSAVELMDPKMDPGMLNKRSKCLGFDGAVKAGKLKLKNIPCDQLVSIMDATLASFVTWLEGHSAVLTIFTNLYLHNPQLIEDRYMKAFCFLFYKVVNLCCETVRRADIFEEEDFQSVLYGFDLLCTLTEKKAVLLAKEAEEDCQKAVKNFRSKADSVSNFQVEYFESILARFQFLRFFFEALISLSATASERTEPFRLREHSPKPGSLEESQRRLHLCEQMLSKIENLPPGSFSCISSNFEELGCFEPNVNQKLLPVTFPRKITMCTIRASRDYLRKLLCRLVAVCGVRDHRATFTDMLGFFRQFNTDNCILSRSVLTLACIVNCSSKSELDTFRASIRVAVRDFTAPPYLSAEIKAFRDAHCEERESFFDGCVRVFRDLLRLQCYNRARQRDRMVTVIKDLIHLQEEADKVDELMRPLVTSCCAGYFHVSCLSSYILYLIFLSMSDYLLLGFELELYSLYEYPYIYWCLAEFTYKWLISLLEGGESNVGHLNAILAKTEKSQDKKKNRTKTKVLKSHRYEIQFFRGLQKLFEAYHKLTLGFCASKRVKFPRHFNDDFHSSIRFEERFAPFLQMTAPRAIDYAQYLEVSRFKEIISTVDASQLFAESACDFNRASALLKELPYNNDKTCQAVTKVARFNAVAAKLLSASHFSASKTTPLFDWSSHCHFPVVRVQ